MSYKYLFGPVPSRRLGTSLGIDLVPYKTCSLNCVYCECGNTTDLTVERKEYVPTEKVMAELDDLLSKKPQIDYLTFSGSGEPTLHKGLGELISFLKDRYPDYKMALLTNGTLFYDKGVRGEVVGCDVILPSLDAGTEECFKGINRPHPHITIQRLVEGLKKLRLEFKGEIWLEVLIVPGMNDGKTELEAIRGHISKIRPDKVQINSLDRPATEIWVEPVDKDALERIADYLGGEVIGKPSSIRRSESFDESMLDRIVSTIRRRPCTSEDLTKILNIHVNELNKYLNYLEDSEMIESERRERGIFFKMRR